MSFNPVQLEILTEEPSMENFLREILPKILPFDYELDVNCFIHPHEGKSSLQKSIPKKVKAYPHYPNKVKLLIVHDQVSNNCKKLKKELLKLCSPHESKHVLVRIACKELENWYLGDLQAIQRVYPESKANKLAGKAIYRDPDKVQGSRELEKMTKNFSKSYASREIPKVMNIMSNTSKSFNHLITGINKILSLD
jgi:uncharacterized membrane protein YheB (UPF0754 family)